MPPDLTAPNRLPVPLLFCSPVNHRLLSSRNFLRRVFGSRAQWKGHKHNDKEGDGDN